jgi:hypothetical protein
MTPFRRDGNELLQMGGLDGEDVSRCDLAKLTLKKDAIPRVIS